MDDSLYAAKVIEIAPTGDFVDYSEFSSFQVCAVIWFDFCHMYDDIHIN